MQTYALVPVVPGPVVNLFSIPDGAALADCVAPAFLPHLHACPATVVDSWTFDGTSFTAPAPVVPTQAQLVAVLAAAAKATCDAITAQVLTSETHVAGYQNASAWVAAAGGVPTSTPYATSFNTLASAMETTAVNLAMLIETLSAASVNLLALMTTLGAAAQTATAAPALAAALASFETGIALEVASLNAALAAADLTTEITAPAAIVIAGINA